MTKAAHKSKSAGQKPAHIRAASGNVYGRNAIWAAIRKLHTFTILDLEGETSEELATIRTYVMGLERAGYLGRLPDQRSRFQAGQYGKGRWELIRDIGVDRPHVDRNGKEVTQGRGREQMWRIMKILQDFNKHDLALNASTDEHQVTVGEAKYYIQYLHKARYLTQVHASKPGTAARYRLLKSRITGPKPPMIQRLDQVFDPNTNQVVWQATPKGVDV